MNGVFWALMAWLGCKWAWALAPNGLEMGNILTNLLNSVGLNLHFLEVGIRIPNMKSL